MSRNIVINSVLIVIALAISITALSLYNLRNAGIKSAIHNAITISETVKSGLTSYMVNNNMHQVDTFIQSISNMKNVDKLWISRSDIVNKQFGHTRDRAKDKIDEDVLETGKMYYELEESLARTIVRVTIPYNAVAEKGIDCLKCHNVAQGTTLGTISLVLDISTLKEIGIESIYVVSLFLLVTIIFFLLYNKKYIMPYFRLYEIFKINISKATNGSFEKIAAPKGLSTDIISLTDEYNNLLQIFKDTTSDIDKKLQVYTGYKTSTMIRNPLKESREIVDNLSNLYQFKKQIELDSTIDEIYNRLKQILINRFHLKNFTFVEIDNKKNKTRKVVEKGNSLYCEKVIKTTPEFCRCARIKNDVVSIKYHNSCQYYDSDKYYYCINLDISKDVTLIIHITCDTIEELNHLKERVTFIKSYLSESAPVLEVKLLMNALKESAFKDGLTGLYNRKFLDEHSKKLIPQIRRENLDIGVLMLDMDHFKAVNDEYGHDIGDKVLKELAVILEDTVRESDIVVRYGGEEFIVLLVNIKSEENALSVANKIAQRVRENEISVYAGNKLKKTISIGLSMFPKDSSSFDTIIKNADMALYEAKNNGRDKVVRFREEHVTSVELF
ncbi:GGDEF domain-containing protein [Halarcobacter ebronensis]|uniref:diguanylate cyclase n=1 Tax=Halarcobacter ebronensis TaxID=1462615 RepID=A0A4Q1AQK6_9BACT|nr:GGDEF domain-containing protein [Halarcobacter ebronensis]QKF81664.1 diguanylate cyclase [Halarcobacter ebronensis]RXK05588.1 hypothetical protein CRV07_08755 [Halarcobacter ebronensis]